MWGIVHSLPYATRLRMHLADSKQRGIHFDRAWKNALAEVTRETGFPTLCVARRPNRCAMIDYSCCDIRHAFRDAYLNIGHGGSMSAIAERERIYVDRYHVAPEQTSRRCGWGGSYCREQGDPYLCPEHGAIIDAIPERCQAHTCRRNETGNGYCDKHAYKAESNARGAALGGRKAAA